MDFKSWLRDNLNLFTCGQDALLFATSNGVVLYRISYGKNVQTPIDISV